MAQAQFPEPDDLDVPYNQMVGHASPVNTSKWTVANPHPGYGKDPNILNEYGHTKYPMWVTLENGERVIANSPAHEAELTGKAVELPNPTSKPAW